MVASFQAEFVLGSMLLDILNAEVGSPVKVVASFQAEFVLGSMLLDILNAEVPHLGGPVREVASFQAEFVLGSILWDILNASFGGSRLDLGGLDSKEFTDYVPYRI